MLKDVTALVCLHLLVCPIHCVCGHQLQVWVAPQHLLGYGVCVQEWCWQVAAVASFSLGWKRGEGLSWQLL